MSGSFFNSLSFPSFYPKPAPFDGTGLVSDALKKSSLTISKSRLFSVRPSWKEDNMGKYKRLTLDDRRHIEEGLDQRLSFSAIARNISRAPSSVSKEVKINRTLVKDKYPKQSKCRKAEWCKATGICVDCPKPGTACARCAEISCAEVCPEHLAHIACRQITSPPWVCNGCKKRGYRCKRPGRHSYEAVVADRLSKTRRSEARRGINIEEERFIEIMAVVRPALARKLSPYEIATLYASELGISPSTLYRWVERGYGGMANILLERKVGFAPRKQHREHKITRHGKKRSYEAFLALSQDEQDACCEMDTVMGKKTDTKCLLTLYLRPAHFQLYVLLEEKTLAEVVRFFDMAESNSRHLFAALFSVLLTDNGSEFEDPALIERSYIKGLPNRCRVFYCDPRASHQKSRCEKNHSELRQMLPKKRTSMDNLTQADIAHINSTINSTPRKSLLGLSPIEMLIQAWGQRAIEFLDLYSIGHLEPDDIDLNALETIRRDDGAGDNYSEDIPF